MKNIFLILLMTSFMISATAQVVQPTAAVKTKFDGLFPTATAVTWKKVGPSYQADFKMDIQSMSALFKADGTYVQKELKIEASGLPEKSRTYLEQNYSGKTVSNAVKVTNANGTIYYKANAGGTALTFDVAGNYVPAKVKTTTVKKAPAKKPKAK